MELVLRAERNRKKHILHKAERWGVSTLLAALILCFCCFVWLRPVQLGNDCMAPTFFKGDVVLRDTLVKYLRAPGRTDIVCIKSPVNGKTLVLRIVGLAGETVSGKNGHLLVNGSFRLVEDDYCASPTPDFEPVTVPEGCVFLLSDNREFTHDSRRFGCVPLSDIRGVIHVRMSGKIRIFT